MKQRTAWWKYQPMPGPQVPLRDVPLVLGGMGLMLFAAYLAAAGLHWLSTFVWSDDMTIGAIVAWVSAQSVWWTLAILPAIWILRSLRNQLVFALWRRNVKAKILLLEKDIAGYQEMHHYDSAAWRKWYRAGLQHLLDAALWGEGVPHGAIEAYNRRRLAIEHAHNLSKDQASIERARREMVEEYCAELEDLGKDQASIERERAALLEDHPEEFDLDVEFP